MFKLDIQCNDWPCLVLGPAPSSIKEAIDILVEVDGSIGLRFINLAQDLEAYLGQKVDLVSRRAIKPTMWQYIERDLIDV